MRALTPPLYGTMLNRLLGHIFSRSVVGSASEIVVVVGALFTGRKREFILKRLKAQLKHATVGSFKVYFHRVMADLNCQLADYCGWSIYVSFERSEARPLAAIKHLIDDRIQVY